MINNRDDDFEKRQTLLTAMQVHRTQLENVIKTAQGRVKILDVHNVLELLKKAEEDLRLYPKNEQYYVHARDTLSVAKDILVRAVQTANKIDDPAPSPLTPPNVPPAPAPAPAPPTESSNEALLNALKNPTKAPFPVKYQIFSSVNHKGIADNWPPSFIPTLERLKETPQIHEKRYTDLKAYFEASLQKLGLQNPLIHFDEKAKRIDIGYGPKEFKTLFPDFTNYGGVFKKEKNYKANMKAEQSRLIKTANIEFNKPLPTKIKPNLSDTQDETKIIKDSLKDNRGLIIGERHEDKSPKQFLIDNMALLKSQGVTTLYMEHLLHESHQKLLDEYLKSPQGAPMPRALEIYAQYLDKERKLKEPATFTSVIRAAKENGIRIIAIDTEATYQVGRIKTFSDLHDPYKSIDRYKVMNMSMLERFKTYDDGGKYIAFVGSAHVATCKKVPGVSDLLGCPNLVIQDLGENQPQEKVEQNIEYNAGREKINFDILYHRNPASKAGNVLAPPRQPAPQLATHRPPQPAPQPAAQPASQLPHAAGSTLERADLSKYPPINTEPASQVVLGDLHGNTLKLVYFLIREGVIKLDEANYNKFRDIYLDWHPGTLTKEALQRDIDSINQIVANIQINKPREVCLIGDILADRGSNDFLTLKVLQRLNEIKLPVEIINSNHDLDFQQVHEEGKGLGFAQNNKQGHSMLNLLDLYNKGLTDNGNPIDKRYIDSMFNTIYKPTLRLVSYNLSDDGKEITLWSHAPIDLDIIRNMSIKLKEIATAKNLPDLDLHFDKSTPTKVAESIDRLNKAFNIYIHKEGNKIADLYSHLYTQNFDDVENMPVEARAIAPFYYAVWNRTYVGPNPLDRRPDILGNEFRVNYGHGHDMTVASKDNVFNLDNILGKYNIRDPDPIRAHNLEGNYDVMRMNGKPHLIYASEADKQARKANIQTEIDAFNDVSSNADPNGNDYQSLLKLLLEISEKSNSLLTTQDLDESIKKSLTYTAAAIPLLLNKDIDNTKDLDRLRIISNEISSRPDSPAKEKLFEFVSKSNQMLALSAKATESALVIQYLMKSNDEVLPPEIKNTLRNNYASLLQRITDAQNIPATTFEKISQKSAQLNTVLADLENFRKELNKVSKEHREARNKKLDALANIVDNPSETKERRDKAQEERRAIYTSNIKMDKENAAKFSDIHKTALKYYNEKNAVINQELKDMNQAYSQTNDASLQQFYLQRIAELTASKDNNDERIRALTKLSALELNPPIDNLFSAMMKDYGDPNRATDFQTAMKKRGEIQITVDALTQEFNNVDNKDQAILYHDSPEYKTIKEQETQSKTNLDNAQRPLDGLKTNLKNAREIYNVNRPDFDKAPARDYPNPQKINLIDGSLNQLYTTRNALNALLTQEENIAALAQSRMELLQKQIAVQEKLKELSQTTIAKSHQAIKEANAIKDRDPDFSSFMLKDAHKSLETAGTNESRAEAERLRLTRELQQVKELNVKTLTAIAEYNNIETRLNNGERMLNTKRATLSPQTPPPTPPPPRVQAQRAQGQQPQGQQPQGQQPQGQQPQGQQPQGQQPQGQQPQGQQPPQGQPPQPPQGQPPQPPQGQANAPQRTIAQVTNELQTAIAAAQAADDAYRQSLANPLFEPALPPIVPPALPTALDLIRRQPANNIQELINKKISEKTHIQMELNSHKSLNKKKLTDPAVLQATQDYEREIKALDETITSLKPNWENAKRLAGDANNTHRRVIQLSEEKVTKIQEELTREENQNPQNPANIQRLQNDLAAAEQENEILSKRAAQAAQHVGDAVTTDKKFENSAIPVFQIYSIPKDKREFENMRKNLKEVFVDGQSVSSRFKNFIDTYDNVAANAPTHAEDRRYLMEMDNKLANNNTDIKGLKLNTIRFIKTAKAMIAEVTNNPKMGAAAKTKEIAALQQEISDAEYCLRRFDDIDKNLAKRIGSQTGYSYFGSGEDATTQVNGADLKIEDATQMAEAHLQNGITPSLRNLGGQFGLVSQNPNDQGAPSPKYTGNFINRFYPANIDSDPRIRGCVIQRAMPKSFQTIIAYNQQDVQDARDAGNMKPVEKDVPNGFWLNEAKKHLHSHLCKENYNAGAIYLKNLHKAPPELLQALVIVAAKEGKTIMADPLTESPANKKLLADLKAKATDAKIFVAQKAMFQDSPENREDPLRRMAKKSINVTIPQIAPVPDPEPSRRRGRP